jgi:hypothetical protein
MNLQLDIDCLRKGELDAEFVVHGTITTTTSSPKSPPTASSITISSPVEVDGVRQRTVTETVYDDVLAIRTIVFPVDATTCIPTSGGAISSSKNASTRVWEELPLYDAQLYSALSSHPTTERTAAQDPHITDILSKHEKEEVVEGSSGRSQKSRPFYVRVVELHANGAFLVLVWGCVTRRTGTQRRVEVQLLLLLPLRLLLLRKETEGSGIR